MKTIIRQVRWALLAIPLVAAMGFVLMAAGSSGPTASAAGTTVKTVDYLFDFFNPLPDPAVWADSGNISPRAVDGRGLQITDLGAVNSLLYFHAAPNFGGAASVTTFSALVRTPSLEDGATAAWTNDATGFRLILDDGQRRAELGLGRDPADPGTPKQRVLVMIGATGVSLVPFPWDNGFHNLYEIKRLASGDFMITATNNDPAGVPVVTFTVPAAQLPASSGAAMVSWGMGTDGGGISEWQEVHTTVSTPKPTPTPTPTPTPAILCADVNGSGRVTLADILLVTAHFGAKAGGPRYETRFDLNRDGRIGLHDILIAIKQYGTKCHQ